VLVKETSLESVADGTTVVLKIGGTQEEAEDEVTQTLKPTRMKVTDFLSEFVSARAQLDWEAGDVLLDEISKDTVAKYGDGNEYIDIPSGSTLFWHLLHTGTDIMAAMNKILENPAAAWPPEWENWVGTLLIDMCEPDESAWKTPARTEDAGWLLWGDEKVVIKKPKWELNIKKTKSNNQADVTCEVVGGGAGGSRRISCKPPTGHVFLQEDFESATALDEIWIHAHFGNSGMLFVEFVGSHTEKVAMLPEVAVRTILDRNCLASKLEANAIQDKRRMPGERGAH